MVARLPIQGTYWLLTIIALVTSLVAVYTQVYVLFAVPILAVAAMAALYFPAAIYATLLLAMPLSIEYYVGALGTDLPSEPLAIVVGFLAIAYILTKKTNIKQLLAHPFSILIALLLLWSIVTAVFSIEPAISIKYLAAKLWYIAGFYVATFIFSHSVFSIKNFIQLLLLPTVLGVAYILYEHALLGFDFDSINAACNPLFRNHVNYAIFLGMLLPYCVFYFLYEKKGSITRLLYLCIIVLLTVAIYFAYTRGVWLALAVLPIALFLIHIKKIKLSLSIAMLAVGVGSCYLLQEDRYLEYAPNYTTTIYHDQLDDHLAATFSGEDMSTMERFYRWIAAIKAVPEYWLHGSGPNTFTAIYKAYTVKSFSTYISKNEERSTVHNYVLLMLVEQGVIGALLYIILVIVFFLKAEQYYHRSKGFMRWLLVAIVCSQIVFIVNNCFSDLVESNKVGSFFYMNLAWLVLWRHKLGEEDFF